MLPCKYPIEFERCIEISKYSVSLILTADTIVNPAFTTVLGYKRIRKKIILNFIHPDDLAISKGS
jgi:hypothetical protein